MTYEQKQQRRQFLLSLAKKLGLAGWIGGGFAATVGVWTSTHNIWGAMGVCCIFVVVLALGLAVAADEIE